MIDDVVRNAVGLILSKMGKYIRMTFMRIPIYKTKKPLEGATAYATYDAIYIDPYKEENRNVYNCAQTLVHEFMHIVDKDMLLVGVFHKEVWNIVADTWNNEMIADWWGLKNDKVLYIDKLNEFLKAYNIPLSFTKDDIYKIDKIKAYHIIEAEAKKARSKLLEIKMKGECTGWGRPDRSGIGDDMRPRYSYPGEGDIIVEPIHYPGELPDVGEDFYRNMRNEVFAGTAPAGMRRAWELRDRLTDFDYTRVLPQVAQQFQDLFAIRTYEHPSRKLAWYYKRTGIPVPSYQYWGPGRAIFLVDASGSITKEALNRFMSEAYAAMKYTQEVLVGEWDAKFYGWKVVTPGVKVELHGGGGTVIRPALKELLKILQPTDGVFVLTDGGIFDIKDSETQKLLSEVGSRAAVAYMFTVAEEPELPSNWHIQRVIIY